MCVFLFRNLRTSCRNVFLVRVLAPAGRCVTLPIATASAAVAAATTPVFTRILTMTLTARRQQSPQRQASTLTSLTAAAVLTSLSRQYALPSCLLIYSSHTHTHTRVRFVNEGAFFVCSSNYCSFPFF